MQVSKINKLDAKKPSTMKIGAKKAVNKVSSKVLTGLGGLNKDKTAEGAEETKGPHTQSDREIGLENETIESEGDAENPQEFGYIANHETALQDYGTDPSEEELEIDTPTNANDEVRKRQFAHIEMSSADPSMAHSF